MTALPPRSIKCAPPASKSPTSTSSTVLKKTKRPFSSIDFPRVCLDPVLANHRFQRQQHDSVLTIGRLVAVFQQRSARSKRQAATSRSKASASWRCEDQTRPSVFIICLSQACLGKGVFLIGVGKLKAGVCFAGTGLWRRRRRGGWLRRHRRRHAVRARWLRRLALQRRLLPRLHSCCCLRLDMWILRWRWGWGAQAASRRER
jgi:hypothetical protein